MNSSRRRFVQRAAATIAAMGGLNQTRLNTAAAQETPAEPSEPPDQLISEPFVISRPTDRYYGWPTLIRRHTGQLLVVASGGRQHHVCPFGRVDLLQSDDDGLSWTFARTIFDGPIDDRDAGIVETPAGTLLVTTFTSLAYLPELQKAVDAKAAGNPVWSDEKLEQWQSAHRRLTDGSHENQLGTWMLRSEDAGLSWSTPYRVPVNSPHGPVVLNDGSLLYAGKVLWEGTHRVGVCRSTDDGRSWEFVADIPAREGDDIRHYHELHAVQSCTGRILVQIRNHNSAHNNETLQTESTDGGLTWSAPRSIGVWGLPSHLLRLKDDRLLMTYGHRRTPLGNQARISSDDGGIWSDPMILTADGTSGDLGYPSTVELADGRLFTVWYEKLADQAGAQLRAGVWTLPE